MELFLSYKIFLDVKKSLRESSASMKQINECFEDYNVLS
jgi:hypothetical protein